MNIKIVKKVIEVENLRGKVAETETALEKAGTEAEVRALGENLKTLRKELEQAEKDLEEMDEKEPAPADPAAERSANPMAEFRKSLKTYSDKADKDQDPTNSKEYRMAFMNFVTRNVAIPAELRANTLTSDVASVIPTKLVNQIIEKMDNVGMILPLVTRTSYAAGVSIPVSSVKPVATWVAEGSGSDRQKKTTGSITFTWHKLRCEISMSMEVGTMALAAFEAKFVENVAKAMVYAIEYAIFNGTGSGQPMGILVAEGGIEESGALSYAKLAAIEGLIDQEYEAGAKWFMNKKTFAKVQGLVDDAGHPIARVNYGIGKAPERLILGRDVVVNPYLADDKMVVFDMPDYILNTIYDMGISKKQDWDTEDLLTKAVMSVDGKPVDMGSLIKYTITA